MCHVASAHCNFSQLLRICFIELEGLRKVGAGHLLRNKGHGITFNEIGTLPNLLRWDYIVDLDLRLLQVRTRPVVTIIPFILYFGALQWNLGERSRGWYRLMRRVPRKVSWFDRQLLDRLIVG
jgi:hypothetical protein